MDEMLRRLHLEGKGFIIIYLFIIMLSLTLFMIMLFCDAGVTKEAMEEAFASIPMDRKLITALRTWGAAGMHRSIISITSETSLINGRCL